MTGRWVSFTHVGTGALLCALLLQAAVLAIGVLPVAGEAGHSGVEDMIEDYDTNTSGGLDVDELAELLEALVDDPTARGDCPDAATLLAASDADSSGELSGEELEHAASELIPCLASLQTIESVHVTVEGKTYVCSPPGGAHDEHEHEDEDHRRVLTMPVPATALTPAQRVRRLAVPDVDAGGSEWECVEEAAEEAEEGHLPTGTVWLYSIIASVVSGLCSVAGIVFMLPAVMALRKYGDDIAACAMGALLTAVFMHMLPEAVAEVGGFTWGLSALFLVGFLCAYVLEHAVHVSREGVEAVVEPDCVGTAEHAAHHGHHIPHVANNDEVLTGVLSPAAANGLRADMYRGGGASTGADSESDAPKPTQTGTDCDCDNDVVVPCDLNTPCSGCDEADVDGTAAVDTPVAPVTGVAPLAAVETAAAAVAVGAPDNGAQAVVVDMADTATLQPNALAVVPHAHGADATGGDHGHGHAHVHSHAHSHSHGHALPELTSVTKREWSELDQPLAQVLPMVYVITIGDFVHNMVDGIVIGAAFMGCDASLGWAVMVAVIIHELPQELGDYVLLRHSGLSNKQALGLNVLSAVGSLLGVAIVVGSGSAATDLVGYFLAVGAGVLTFIAASDILPPLMHERSAKRGAIRFLVILVSVGIVALTLLHDVHCESGEAGGHDGHGHRGRDS